MVVAVPTRTQLFRALCRKHGIPSPTAEYRFHGDRRWRMDYAWLDQLVALEVEGGAFSGGRHTRGAGFRKDLEKYNTAASEGWLVLRCLPEQLLTQATIDLVRHTLERAP